MYQGKLVFSQVMTCFRLTNFRRCVAAHWSEDKVKDFSCLNRCFAIAFAPLTYQESLRDIEINLRAQAHRLCHMGSRCSTISRTALDQPRLIRRDCFDQQLYAQPRDDQCTLQATLAGRTALQMDQATLRIKASLGTSENAVRTKIWIAVSTYVLITIVKKTLASDWQPLRDSTNPESDYIPNNTNKSTTYTKIEKFL